MKIFIDQGHNNSNWNTGATGNGLKEQDISYEIGKKLSDKLKKLGLETKLSREIKERNLGKDNKTSIIERYKMSNNWNADYFISLHCNAGGGTGAETLYYKNDSKEYAKIIQEEYIKEMKLKDRGIKYRDNIGVIKHTKAKSILLEMGFIDNKIDADILKNKQEEILKGITKGFCKLLNIKYNNKGENNKEENNNNNNTNTENNKEENNNNNNTNTENNKEENNNNNNTNTENNKENNNTNTRNNNKGENNNTNTGNNNKGEKEMRYNKIEELPSWSKETIKKLLEKNYIVDKNNLNLSEDMLRIFVINDRAGVYR